jgi:transposase
MRKLKVNREEILARLRQPGAPSVTTLAEETGIPVSTIYSWIVRERKSRQQASYQGGTLAMTKRVKHRTPEAKLRLVGESLPLKGEALLTFCTANGVTLEELLSWRDVTLSGLEQVDRDGKGRTHRELRAELERLEEDVRRKNDALAETAALLVLQKKTSDLLSGKK